MALIGFSTKVTVAVEHLVAEFVMADHAVSEMPRPRRLRFWLSPRGRSSSTDRTYEVNLSKLSWLFVATFGESASAFYAPDGMFKCIEAYGSARVDFVCLDNELFCFTRA